ncbi:MAG: hypothetical protein WAU02_00825 [Candidatus Saccharimonadales bacterium]
MIKKFITSCIAASLAVVMMVVSVPSLAGAIENPITSTCGVDSSSTLCKPSEKLFGPDSIWTKIINTLIYITGAIAVIMIVIGGMRFTLSGGDASGTKSARETIIYAVVGLGVTIMAYAVVNFVLSRL